jgi:hypothetical protein
MLKGINAAVASHFWFFNSLIVCVLHCVEKTKLPLHLSPKSFSLGSTSAKGFFKKVAVGMPWQCLPPLRYRSPAP